MVTALGGCGAAAATVPLASVENNVAEFALVCVDAGNKASDNIRASAPGAMSAGEARHV